MSNFIYFKNGDLFVFGYNYYGQLGLCNNYRQQSGLGYKDIEIPTLLMTDKTIKNIICGKEHTIIYKENGDVLGFGSDNDSQLGLDQQYIVSKPTLLMTDKKIKNIHCGVYHTIIHKEDGNILGLGSNMHGQLSLGYRVNISILIANKIINRSNTIIYKPTLLMSDKTIKNIICGYSHTIIYKDNGDVIVFGCNLSGELGLGHSKDIRTPTLLMNDKQSVSGASTIRNIICGAHYTIIYKDNGDVLVFGCNDCGQLGLGYDENNVNKPTLLMNDTTIKNIICGHSHTILYKNNGDILGFGCNYYGELGLGHNKNIYKPTLLMNDKNIKNIICGAHYTIIYKDNGDVLVFGKNNHGQLGLGHNKNINVPTLLMNRKDIISINGIKIIDTFSLKN